MKFYHLYITTDCLFCKKAIDILEQGDKVFVVSVMDRAPELLEAIKQQHNHLTVPVVLEMNGFNQGRLIGGCRELEQHLKSEVATVAETTFEETGENDEEDDRPDSVPVDQTAEITLASGE